MKIATCRTAVSGAWVAALALVGLVSLSCNTSYFPPPEARAAPVPTGNGLNVLLITVGNVRADHLGAYGYFRHTSRYLNFLVQEGTLFQNAYTARPDLMGGLGAVLSGRVPSTQAPGVGPSGKTLASLLRSCGYVTSAVIADPQLSDDRTFANDFDSYREVAKDTKGSDLERRATTETARALSGGRVDRPLFVWLHYAGPRPPYRRAPSAAEAFRDSKAASGPLLSAVDGYSGGMHRSWSQGTPRPLGEYVARYDGQIAVVDREIGRVVEALRERGLFSKTIIVVTADAGENLGEHDEYFHHGDDLFDAALRVPLLIRVPGAPAQVYSSMPASTLDVVPTILDALKLPLPVGLSGRSLLPAIEGRQAGGQRWLFASTRRGAAAVFDNRFKLVASGSRHAPALYDRATDAQETTNVARNQPSQAAAMQAELARYAVQNEATHALADAKRARAELPGPAGSPCEAERALGYTGGCR